MTIEIYCQKCGQRMQISDQYAGQTGKCKKCGNAIAVPAQEPQSAFKQIPQQHSAAIPYKWIAGTVLGMAILAMGIYALFLRGDPSTSPTPPTSSQAETTTPPIQNTANSGRTVTFPIGPPVGRVFMRDVGEPFFGRKLGPAHGPVVVPEGKEIGLFINEFHPANLAFLEAFGSNDLDYLMLVNPLITNDDIRNIEHMTGLTFILVEYNEVTDAGLRSLRPLVNLKFLGLGGTKITDAGLSTLTFLHRLEGLSVGGTRITDQGIRSLKSLPLNTIMLSGMALTRPMVDVLKEIPGLTYLRIDSGRPSDANRIPGGDRPTSLDSILLLREITQLQTLVLSGKLHDDSLIPALSKLTQLKKIEFGNTSITQVGKNELKRALPNCEIPL